MSFYENGIPADFPDGIRKGEFSMKKISLYCVPTPIGNLSDMPPRGLEVIRQADFVAAEDTRKTGLLLNHFGIKKPLVSYYEPNRRQRGEMIVSRLLEGEVCCLVTDAGTPAVSDPGQELVEQCLSAGLSVSSIPGPCAAVTALSMSGICSKRFCFEGFLSTAKNRREEHLSSLANETRTMIFYEAPHRLRQTLFDLFRFFGDRKVSLVREISKIYEETLYTTLSQAMAYYEEKDPKGEFVLVIEGFGEAEKAPVDDHVLEAEFRSLLEQGKPKSYAAKTLSVKYGRPRREIYEKFKDL